MTGRVFRRTGGNSWGSAGFRSLRDSTVLVIRRSAECQARAAKEDETAQDAARDDSETGGSQVCSRHSTISAYSFYSILGPVRFITVLSECPPSVEKVSDD